MPDNTEDFYDDLMDSNDKPGFIRNLSKSDAGWLAIYIRKRCRDDRERIGQEIEDDLKVRLSLNEPEPSSLTLRRSPLSQNDRFAILGSSGSKIRNRRVGSPLGLHS